jgi:PKD repeat protein
MNDKKSVCTLLLMLLILVIAVFALANPSKLVTQGSSVLTITAKTDQQIYRLRQNATVSGNVTLGGSPATDLVVAVEVNFPSPYGCHSFRTLQIGNPTGPWSVNITSIYLQDISSNPIDTVKAGSQMQVGMNVYNLQSTTVNIYATTTVYDANMVSVATNLWMSTVDPLETVGSKFLMQVPSWACSGRALIIGCVYSNEPASGGLALCPERAFYYCISRTQSGLLGITQPPPPPPQTTLGVYASPIRLPPDPRPGTYSVYVLGQSNPATISSATTSFTVQSTNGIPPQASFAYSPPTPTIYHDVSFDASSSTPEGYNDRITTYDWDFGDGTPHFNSTGDPANPTTSHVYTQATQYIVTLNVTNSEGLWCTTSKPITIGLGYGPTANFTWTPQRPVINETVTFDASNSTPGDYSTLVNYMWNFSDGTGVFNVSTPQTIHSFIQPGNYTVMLTVLDSASRTQSTSATVQVQNATIKLYDLNHDGKIDGKDLTIIGHAFGSYGPDFHYPGEPASPNWDPRADTNGDNKIDGKDLTPIAKNFGMDP